MSALAGGVFAATDTRDDDAQLCQLVDDLGQRSYEARLGHRGIPDRFDAELWRNLEDTGLARLTSSPDAGAGPNEVAIALYGLARHAGAVPMTRLPSSSASANATVSGPPGSSIPVCRPSHPASTSVSANGTAPAWRAKP
jgi:alkylation response protein AidB-like acyl-CoA dehydrogenase